MVEISFVEIHLFRMSHIQHWSERLIAPDCWSSTFWSCCMWKCCLWDWVCLLSDEQEELTVVLNSFPASFFSFLFSSTKHHLPTYWFIHISARENTTKFHFSTSACAALQIHSVHVLQFSVVLSVFHTITHPHFSSLYFGGKCNSVKCTEWKHTVKAAAFSELV